jgi:hypothetical protein
MKKRLRSLFLAAGLAALPLLGYAAVPNNIVAGDPSIFSGSAINAIYDYLRGNSSGTYVGTFTGPVTGAVTGALNGSLGATTPSTVAATTFTASGATSTVGGIGANSAPTVWHSGGVGANSATMGTDTTPSVTETYIVEVFVPVNTTLTGVSVLNGSAVAGNMQISLATSAGVPITAAQTASTAASGTAAFQQVPFAAPYAAVGPAKYLILLQNNNTGNRFRSHAVGNFGASKKTGETYGTFTTVTAPTTFTTALGPVADVY